MVSRFFLFLVASCIFFSGIATDSRAQDTADSAAHSENQDSENPDDRFVSVYEKTKSFTEGLDPSSKAHFSILLDAYNVAHIVEMVEAQVGDAIQKCGVANPGMKALLDARYKSWRGEIDPVLAEAKANYENMIAAQDYAKPQQIQDIMAFVKKKRLDMRSNQEPVTTPEACEYLRAKMDETEQNLTELLRRTLISLPQRMQEMTNQDSDDDSHDHDDHESSPASSEEAPE